METIYAKTWQELALHLVRLSRARYDAYEEDVREWYRNGEGRSTRDGGRGYTYPACIHGSSRWTDYDNICGPCEDGDGYWDYIRELEYAKTSAKAAFIQMQDRMNLFVDLSYKARYEGLPVVIDQAGWNEYVMAPVEMRK